MSGLICVLFGKLVIEIARVIGREKGKPKPQPICTDCLFAHVQYPSKGRPAISCTFGGAVRTMKLDVHYCTDYRDRNRRAPARLVGFVPANACREPSASA
jgi:hypothetical protein